MEVAKLYNVTFDLEEDNSELNQTELINNLITSISQNETQQINKLLIDLEASINQSKANTFSFSSSKILAEIKGSIFFGQSSLKAIKKILNENPFNNNLTIQKLQEYSNNRTAFITQISSLNTIFKELKINAHFYEDDTYEVGIILPEKVTENKIVDVTKILQKWDQIFKSLKEINGDSVEDTKIALVNNGSLDFFFESAPHIALCLSIIIERLATLYKRILEIRVARLKLAELGAPKSEIVTIEQHESNEIEKEVKAIADKIMKEYSNKLTPERKNELKTALTAHIKYIANSIDRGIMIEVTPPEITPPELLKEQGNENTKKINEEAERVHKEKLAKIELVVKSNELVKEIVGLGSDVFKYLSSGESNDEAEST